jgi:hypothetical protein
MAYEHNMSDISMNESNNRLLHTSYISITHICNMMAVFSLLSRRWYFFELELRADNVHIIFHYEPLQLVT